jgi:hypothetical protein
MAYIGNNPAHVGNYQEVDALTGFNGVKTSFALTANSKAISPAKSGQLLVSINGVMQEPDDSGTNGFKVVGSNIVFSGPPASGDSSWLMFQGQNVDIGTPSEGVVSESKLNVSNSPTNGYVLTAQSGATGGLTWAADSTSDSTKLPLAGGTMTGTIATFTSTGIDDNATSTAITIDSSENVTVGTGFLTLGTENSVEGRIDLTNETSTGTGVRLRTNGNSYLNGGNVGIGTSSPASARGIAGSVLHISDTPDAALRITDTGGSDFEISAETNTWLGTVDDTDLILGANNSERIRITNGGNVGIGTSSPSYNFEVSGGSSEGFVLRSTNSYQVGMSLRYNTNTIAARWCTHASMAGVSSTDVSSGFYVDNGQNFNIGFGTVVKVYVTPSGDLTAVGNITAYSDERIKENISEIPNALDAVDAIRGVTYTRTDTKEDGVGVIAQEVEEVFPELIHESNDGIKSVNYNGLVGVLFAAVKELSAKVKQLENK